MSKTLKARIISNSALASEWTSNNPVLLKGEFGIEIDTGKIKVGDGVLNWNSLSYIFSGALVNSSEPSTNNEVGTLWLKDDGTGRLYYLREDNTELKWTQLVTSEDLANLGAGDMLKSVFATNSKVDQGYVDKAISADEATKLKTARTISATGDVTGSTSFDGSANVSINTTLKNSGVTSGTYPKVTVNTKGVVTGGSDLAVTDIPSLPNTKITGLGTASTKDVGSSAGQVPVLDSKGKLDEGVIPSLAIMDSEAVSSQVEMLALDVQKGDIAIRTDINKTFILSGEDPSVLANWLELRTPTDAVLSVAGKVGAVTLNKSDVGLSNVDNTSDANKPVSTATQTALNAKVDKVTGKGLSEEDFTSAEKTKLSGIETGAEKNKVNSVAGKTGAVTLVKGDVGLGNVDNTSDLSKPVSTATQTALNNKVDKVSGKGLSTNDFSNTEKNKLAGIETGAQVNVVTSVAGKQGAVALAVSDLTNGSDVLLQTDTLILDGGTHS